MTRHLYTLLLYLAAPMLLLRLLVRSVKVPAYRQRLGERFGWLQPRAAFDRSRQLIWIHAVSVGETMAAATLVQALRSRHPDRPLLFSTTTATGATRARELFADEVLHAWLPYDLPGALRRFIRHARPGLLILMETELWPNLIHVCQQQGVRVIVANARLSEQSANGYRRFGRLVRPMLERIDYIAAQAPTDADRLIELGAGADRVEVTGSLKFQLAPRPASIPDGPVFDSVRRCGRAVIVAASTQRGEERKLLTTLRRLLQHKPDLLFIIVPRHPQRFDEVARLCRGFPLQRRSANEMVRDSTTILLGDSMGEMSGWYALADLAFVGGSLVDKGGQNVLEPAALGRPVIIGPSRHNFAAVCEQLEQAGALATVADEEQLAKLLLELLDDPARRKQMGARARALVEDEQNRQALPRLLDIIQTQLR